jgi:hypothetical protein
VKVHQLLSEKKVDDVIGPDYQMRVRHELQALGKSVAETLKIRWYKLPITYSSQQEAQHRWHNVKGDIYVMKADVPEDMDSDFFGRMAGKLVDRELKKRFSRSKVLLSDVSKFTSDRGFKIDTVYVTFYIPDMDGLLP